MKDESPSSLVQTLDGGYAMAGSTLPIDDEYNRNFLLVKTDEQSVIPEFPSWVILPLFLMTALFAVVLKKRICYLSAT